MVYEPCRAGHAWEPVCGVPGQPGWTLYTCRVCGERKTMVDGGDDQPKEAAPQQEHPLEQRVAALERAVADLLASPKSPTAVSAVADKPAPDRPSWPLPPDE